MDTLPDGLRVIDQNYTVIMANNAYAAQLQEDPAFTDRRAMLRRARGSTEPCPPTLVTCPFAAIESDGQSVKYIDRHMRKDGKEALFEITAARLALNGGGEARTLVIEEIRDMTEQVRYSQEQRLAEIGQLATGVAHEIYNPLASVRLGLQFIMKRHPDGAGLDRGHLLLPARCRRRGRQVHRNHQAPSEPLAASEPKHAACFAVVDRA